MPARSTQWGVHEKEAVKASGLRIILELEPQWLRTGEREARHAGWDVYVARVCVGVHISQPRKAERKQECMDVSHRDRRHFQCICLCFHVSLHESVYFCVGISVFLCLYMYLCICICVVSVSICICAYICICICVYVCICL